MELVEEFVVVSVFIEGVVVTVERFVVILGVVEVLLGVVRVVVVQVDIDGKEAGHQPLPAIPASNLVSQMSLKPPDP